MITYVKLKHDIVGLIWRSFWDIKTQAEHLSVWIVHDTWLNETIALNIIVRLCIFSLRKYDRIFGKNLEHDNYGVKQSPSPSTLCVCGGGAGGVITRFGLWNLY